MTIEDPKSRRNRSISLTLQSSQDDSSSGYTSTDVFSLKRIKNPSVICMFCRYIDPVFWVLKLLKLILQHSVMLTEMTHRCMKKWCSRYYGNLKWFIQSYPPMVLFTLSISLFAILLTVLAVYVSKTAALNEMDVSQDWNMFLQSFSDLEFCVIQDNSSVQLRSPATMQGKSLESAGVRTVSVMMSLSIYPTKDFVSMPHNAMHLSASMNTKYIGLKDSGGKHRLNVTTIVPYRFNASSCSNIPLQGCEVVEVEACFELTGPPDVFPRSNRKPKSCQMPSLSGVDYWAKMNWQLIDLDSVYYCRSRTMIGMRHEYDPSLFQPLKKPHRSVIRLHLLHTSFFLYVFVAVVIIYAMIFNHAKQRLVNSESPVYDF